MALLVCYVTLGKILNLCNTQCPLHKMGTLTVFSSWSSLKIKWVNMCKALSMVRHVVSATWALIVSDVATYSSHDTLWVRLSKGCHLCFVCRNKGSEEAKSSAQSDTTNTCQKWDLNLYLSILRPSGAFPNIEPSCSVSWAKRTWIRQKGPPDLQDPPSSGMSSYQGFSGPPLQSSMPPSF